MSNFLNYSGLERFYGKSRLENVQGKTFQLLLSLSYWVDNEQTVTSDMLDSNDKYNYLVSPTSHSYSTYSQHGVYMDDVTTDGSVTFHCKTQPNKDIYINLIRLEVH